MTGACSATGTAVTDVAEQSLHRQGKCREQRTGLDAYCTFVVDVDNQGHVALHVAIPAPQPGDANHYDTFVIQMCRIYSERYGNLDALPTSEPLDIEEALIQLARVHPGLLRKSGDLAVQQGLSGAEELRTILGSIEASVPGPTEERSAPDETDA